MSRVGVIGTCAALALGLAACAGPGKVTISTNKRTGYDRKLGRVLIRYDNEKLPADLLKSVQAQLGAELKSRGIESSFIARQSQLALDAGPNFQKLVKDYAPTHVLLIDPAGGTVNQYGTLLLAKADARLFDIAADSLVWRAAISWSPGPTMYSVEERASIPVYEIMMALFSDGLLEGPAPTKRDFSHTAPPPEYKSSVPNAN